MSIKGMSLALLLSMFSQVAFASDNYIDVYVARSTLKCVSFNLAKIDLPTTMKHIEVCPGHDNLFTSLDDGKYNLYATEVDSLTVNPLGDTEYVADPIILQNWSGLAVYYPSRFQSIKMDISYPSNFKQTK